MKGIERAVSLAETQAALASELGVTYQAVQHWLKQGYTPLHRGEQIHDIYGIPIEDLLRPDMAALVKGAKRHD